MAINGMSLGETRTFLLATGETTVNKYHVSMLDLTTENQVINPTGDAVAGERVAGVLIDYEHEAGEYAAYQTSGFAKITLCGTVTVGDMLCVGSTAGAARKLVVGTDNNVTIIGRATQAGVSGDRIIAELTIPNEYHS